MRFNSKVALILLFTFTASGGAWWAMHPPPSKRAEKSQTVWRSMRVVWKTPLRPNNATAYVTNLLAYDDRLYYVSSAEVGCLAQRTGRFVWRRSLIPRKVDDSQPHWWEDRSWRIAVADGKVFACELYDRGSTPDSSSKPYRVRAFDAQTGKRLWEQQFDRPWQGVPCPMGAWLLLATATADVVALRQRDGKRVWRRHWAKSHPRTVTDSSGNVTQEGNYPSICLQAEGEFGVALLGAQRLIGFRLKDGKLTSEYRPEGVSATAAEGGWGDYSEGFVLKDGVAYVLIDGGELVAVDVATGKLLWSRDASYRGPAPLIFVWEDKVIANISGASVAVRRSDGKTVWFRQIPWFPKGLFPGGQPELTVDQTGTVFVCLNTPTHFGDERSSLLSVPELDTLIALDAKTGCELWRWQPYEGFGFNEVVAAGERLFMLSGDDDLYAVAEGSPPRLSSTAAGRQRLAEAMVESLFDWKGRKKPPVEIPMQFVKRWAFGGLKPYRPETTEAQLTLLRLGKDSVLFLMEFVRYELKKQDAIAPRLKTGMNPIDASESLKTALDLLLDIRDHSVVPELSRLLERTKDAGSRRGLAETLIRFGDVRACSALFQYARSSQEHTPARQAALRFVCRSQQQSNFRPAREEVTTYLLAQLRNAQAPGWLRAFAQFELLNDRGELARQAALAAFKQERTTRLLPQNAVLKIRNDSDETQPRSCFPTGIDPSAIARDERGRWWAAFFCNYLSDYNHLWFAQSKDKKRWVKPAFGVNLSALCRQRGYPRGILTLTCRRDRLVVRWTEEVSLPSGKDLSFPRRTTITVSDLYRDSDRDGLTDFVEKEIGTDPKDADTNDNGILDGEDKNPLYRPHTLTDEEGIFQAAVEALCQLGRRVPIKKTYGWNSETWLSGFGQSTKPLYLIAPKGSTGVEVLGHAGMVICRPDKSNDRLSVALGDMFANGFTHPFIQWDGVLDSKRLRWWQSVESGDPFAPGRLRPPEPMRLLNVLPYRLSPDRKRARIGWEYSGPFFYERSEGYDIEVRKIGNRWLPVECLKVYESIRDSEETLVTPLRQTRKP